MSLNDIITLRNINFTYEQAKSPALKDINISVKKGEVVLLCGPSGSGKSTILQLINGICPELQSGNVTGELLLNGENAQNISIYERAKHIGSLFQNSKSQFFHLNTTDEILFTASNFLMPISEMKNRLEEVSKQFNIEHLLDRETLKLSGGEKQKIAFASIAVNNPEIYLLDEPSASLDEKNIQELANIIKTLKANGSTIIISEHRLYYLMDIIDCVCYMRNGIIEEQYETKEFISLSEEKRCEMGLRKLTHTNISDLKTSKFYFSEDDAVFVSDFKVEYKDKPVIDIDYLKMPTNKIVFIVGENGVGKSTFVNALTGIHKVEQGRFNRKHIHARTQQKNSFMVMQDVNSQLFCESAIEELIQLTEETADDIIRAKEALKRLNLLEFENQHPRNLSGGQKQRLAIATAMFLNKKYLVLDEPTSGLDYDNMLRVSKLLKELKEKIEFIVVITHDSELIETCSDYIVEISKINKCNLDRK